MVKRIASMIFAVIISLLLVANPVFAGIGNGKTGGNGKTAAVKASASEKAGKAEKSLQEKKATTLQLEFKFQKQEKAATKQQEHGKAAAKQQLRDIENHWAKNCIERVQTLGWISGYPDMTFRPDAPVTGIEALAMVVSMAEDLEIADGEDAAAVNEEEQDVVSEDDATGDTSSEGVNEDEEEPMPSDVPAWAKGAMKKAVALKIVNVDRFHSQVQATRAQVAVMLAKALGLQPVDTSGIVFSDQVLISSEDIGYILALAEAGIIKGTPEGKFNPNSAITRAEIAAMLANVADSVEVEETGGVAEEEAEEETEASMEGSSEGNLAPSDEQSATESETIFDDDQIAAEAA